MNMLRKKSVWLALAASLLAMAWGWHSSELDLARMANERFSAKAERVRSAIAARFLAQDSVLDGGVGFFAASKKIDRSEWHDYVSSLELDEHHYGIRLMGFSKKISPLEKASHIEQVRSEGFPEYNIWPPGEREEYTAVIYIEPFSNANQKAFGYDMFSEQVRRRAMERARDMGHVVLSDKIVLMTEPDKEIPGFLMYAPVYRKGLPHETVEERRASLEGYVYILCGIREFVEGVIGQESEGIDLDIFDGKDTSGYSFFYDSNPDFVEASEDLYATRDIEFNGHLWTLTFRGRPEDFLSAMERQRPALVVAGVFLISILLLTMAKRLVERAAMEEALKQKGLELEEMNRTLNQRVMEEVTRNREKDHLMIQQSRLAGMGEMIGNIAHQWRQPLNSLGLVIQDLRDAHEHGEMDKAYLDNSIRESMELIRHMSMTIDDFRNFFRPNREVKEFNLKDAVDKALSFVGKSFKNNNIEIETEVMEEIRLTGHQNEYSQAVLNILGNAKEALLEGRVERPRVRLRLFMEDGSSVLTISDNAGGIPEDIMERIFDPYFTTKDEGRGTGIGLYMSKAIIEKHMGGELTVRNVDGGAEFRVEVPLTPPPTKR